MPPKFRLFAGPNGSGKTSLFENLRKNGFIHTEIYVNADRYERELKENLNFNFNAYRVKVSQREFLNHIKNSTLYSQKIADPDFLNKISIKGGVLKFNLPKSELNSYHASFVASYLVEKLLETNQSFCFETVMSHISKVELITKAKSNGYKSYLYFVYTKNPELNITRVQLRALMGLHDVNPDLIKNRYKRSFELLPLAFKETHEAYLFDNSDALTLVAQKRNGKVTFDSSISDDIKKTLL